MCVAASIGLFVPFELLGSSPLRCGFIANLWPFAVIAMLWIERVIDPAMEVVGAMKPRADTDENAAVEPFRAVVAVGNAVIRRVVIVTVGTVGCDSDVDADLSLCFESGCRKEHSSNSGS